VIPVPTDRAAAAPKPAGRFTDEQHAHLAELLTSARDGDRESLKEMVALLTPLLWQVARAQGLDQDSSGDVVQTTWLHLLGSLTKIRSPIALTGWLITVTKREAWRVRESGRAEKEGSVDAALARLPDPQPVPEERLLDSERRRSLWSAVGQLSPRCQQLLRIVAFVPRPSYEALSAALDMPPGSIGPTRGRCLAKLRDLLAADPGRSWL
jgi:RNA polymerase sigma factor (sigma-70 family)